MDKIIGILTGLASNRFFADIFLAIIFFAAIFLYYKINSFECVREKFKKLAVTVIIFKGVYAIFLTFIQYYVWHQNKFTEMLVNMPASGFLNGKYGYFIFYSFGRFWLSALISVGTAYLFYLFLIFLKKYRERFFEEGEIELGFLAALIVGWPNFVIFVPLVFIFVVLVSILKIIFLKETHTTLAWPFILAVLAIMAFGGKLEIIFKLGVLKI